MWAHCLVRSRALSLQLPAEAPGGGPRRLGQLDLCMLPGVDLCNHPTSGAATCAVHLRLSRCRTRCAPARARPQLPAAPSLLRVRHLARTPPDVLLLVAPGRFSLSQPERGAITRQSRRWRACSVVELRATRDLAAGEQVLLSYGERPLRDFLRGYAFLPHTAHEVPTRRDLRPACGRRPAACS